jgi:TonB family protein
MHLAAVLLLVLAFADVAIGQRIAVLSPDHTQTSREFAAKLSDGIARRVTVIDPDLARAAFEASNLESPYNLSLDEAKRAGQAMGCDFFLLVKADVVRRSSFEKDEYYDADAAILLVSSRSGRLVFDEYQGSTADKPEDAVGKLSKYLPDAADRIVERAKEAQSLELSEKPLPTMEEPPDADSPLARNFKAPVPFVRIKPEYTKLAERNGISATVDIQIDLDANGHIVRNRVLRWAGFGLDRSVEAAVEQMNWGAAERDGKFIPMRFVARYNFRRPETK